jgi:hypothetical protein
MNSAFVLRPYSFSMGSMQGPIFREGFRTEVDHSILNLNFGEQVSFTCSLLITVLKGLPDALFPDLFRQRAIRMPKCVHAYKPLEFQLNPSK